MCPASNIYKEMYPIPRYIYIYTYRSQKYIQNTPQKYIIHKLYKEIYTYIHKIIQRCIDYTKLYQLHK